MPAHNKGRGKCVQWLRDRVDHDDEACLIWPFSRHPTGYGSFGYLGEMHYAHRFMCELVNGPAPEDKPYASHGCGKGHEGCVNPKHVEWKTPTDNALDRIAHGNNWKKGERTRPTTLNRAKADEIRALKGRLSQHKIAAKFGVSRETVSHIHCGRVWAQKSNEFLS